MPPASVVAESTALNHPPTAINEINRSKEVWGPDADVFNPDRYDDATYPRANVPGVWGNLITFIGGPHNCLYVILPTFRSTVSAFLLTHTQLQRLAVCHSGDQDGPVRPAAQLRVCAAARKAHNGAPRPRDRDAPARRWRGGQGYPDARAGPPCAQGVVDGRVLYIARRMNLVRDVLQVPQHRPHATRSTQRPVTARASPTVESGWRCGMCPTRHSCLRNGYVPTPLYRPACTSSLPQRRDGSPDALVISPHDGSSMIHLPTSHAIRSWQSTPPLIPHRLTV